MRHRNRSAFATLMVAFLLLLSTAFVPFQTARAAGVPVPGDPGPLDPPQPGEGDPDVPTSSGRGVPIGNVPRPSQPTTPPRGIDVRDRSQSLDLTMRHVLLMRTALELWFHVYLPF